MKQFISFVIKEAKHILRDKRTMLILFGMPVVMMLLFGFAITTDVRNVRTVVVTSQMDHQTQQAVERLPSRSTSPSPPPSIHHRKPSGSSAASRPIWPWCSPATTPAVRAACN